MWIASEPMMEIPIGRGVSRGFRNKDCQKKKKKKTVHMTPSHTSSVYE